MASYVPPPLYVYAAPATVKASDFLASLGVNAHIDYIGGMYPALPVVETALNYVGVKTFRDSPNNSGELATYQDIAAKTGAKFDAYIGETSIQGMADQLALFQPFVAAGVVSMVEGPNEEDDSYPAGLGNTIAAAAAFQAKVYAFGQANKLPVVNLSFGAGWTAANNWHGDYDKVGDLSTVADYANAHTYPNPPDGSPSGPIAQLDSDAKLAAASRPVITSEIGWDENQGFSQANVAKYVLTAAFEGMRQGNPMTMFYALYDDGSGKFGLMNTDGTAKPAGTALHNLTALLADAGSFYTPSALSYTAAGMTGTDYAMTLQKADGTHWLALWPSVAGAHTVTLTLPSAVPVSVYDALTGTAALSTGTRSSVAVALADHPMLVQVGPAVAAPAPAPAPVAPAPAPVTIAPAALAPSPVIVVATVAPPSSYTVPVAGVSLSDAWAAQNAGKAGLFLSTDLGTLSVRLSDGTTATAAAGTRISLADGLANLNAALATMSLTATKTGTAHVTVDFWDQAGIEATKTVTVAVK